MTVPAAPVPMREDTTFWPLLTDLASALCGEIADSGLPEPCFCGVLPGEIVPLDYCQACSDSTCGMAWVRLVRLAPSGTSDDVPGRTPNHCTVPMEATIEVGISRCAPMPNDEGEPPTMADQLDATRLLMADQAAALRAIRCNVSRVFDISGWTPMGPQGGCLGGFWTVTVGQF